MGSLGTPAVIGIFLAAAIATWVAGVYLSKATDAIDDHFNLGEALGGMILLGIAGTLPELAITVSAAIAGHIGLATGNLLGGIAMQTLVLVVLDATSRRKEPLTSLSDSVQPMLEAVLVVVVVTTALMGPLLKPSTAIGGVVSPVSIAIVVLWLVGMVVLNRVRRGAHWKIVKVDGVAPITPVTDAGNNRLQHARIATTLLVFGAGSIVTLAAGVTLERTGNELATRWGVNGVVFGATVLASVTALPEVSTGIAAVRLGKVGLAMGDIFGGNAIQVTLFLLADLLAGSPVLSAASPNAVWLGALGVVVTAVYAGGLLIRAPRKWLGLAPVSLAVVFLYLLGVLALPFLRS